MCGIFALVDAKRIANKDKVLSQALHALSHRGPDAHATLSHNAVSLAFCRLSIVDEAGGMQPLTNEDDSVALICNGEIYNYKTLRADLEARGHRFKTNSDCEVIVHLYEEDPVGYVTQLDGMFAFMLLDKRGETLELARDRVGIKPLTFYSSGGLFIAASEIKALLASGLIPKQFDRQAVRDTLVFNFPPGEQTVFEGVRTVRPGTVLRVAADASVHERTFWELTFPKATNSFGPFAPWVLELQKTLALSVKSHMIGDRPVAAYLSGGIDSTVTALLLRQSFSDPSLLQTFSVAFPGEECDESNVFTKTAEELHFRSSVHESRRYDSRAFQQSLYYLEQPQTSPMDIPLGELSGLVRSSGTKVVLSGEGADELFGGYPSFKLNQARRALDLVPSFKARLLPRVLHYYLGRTPTAEWLTGTYLSDLKPVAERFGTVPAWYPFWNEREEAISSVMAAGLASSLASDSAMAQLTEPLKDRLKGIDDFNKSLYIEMRGRLPNYILQRTDRNSMRNSVEARVPYLSNQMIDLSGKIPPMLKMFGIKEKYILRKAFERDVPAHVLKRLKFGYHSPLRYLWESSDALRDEVLSESRLREVGLFNAEMVQALRAEAAAVQDHDRKDKVLGTLTAVLSVQLLHDSLLR